MVRSEAVEEIKIARGKVDSEVLTDPAQELDLGKGHVLFAAYPLELGDNPQALGSVYAYAMRKSGVLPLEESGVAHAGILISPTEYEDATLYAITSETQREIVTFVDRRSGKTLSTSIDAGRAAAVMIKKDGTIVSSYRWGL